MMRSLQSSPTQYVMQSRHSSLLRHLQHVMTINNRNYEVSRRAFCAPNDSLAHSRE